MCCCSPLTRSYFAIGLELAYLLMPLWAVLLAIQIGVFWRPTQPDRTFKFVRAAYVWLVISCGMMPFFPLYGVLTHQVFAHTYMGSHRHAFTVGFISMMIMGVSSRVVPILAGIDAKRMNSLWAPFFYSTWAVPAECCCRCLRISCPTWLIR